MWRTVLKICKNTLSDTNSLKTIPSLVHICHLKTLHSLVQAFKTLPSTDIGKNHILAILAQVYLSLWECSPWTHAHPQVKIIPPFHRDFLELYPLIVENYGVYAENHPFLWNPWTGPEKTPFLREIMDEQVCLVSQKMMTKGHGYPFLGCSFNLTWSIHIISISLSI